jgi:uncharacterized membrane protein (UPF0127 family)
LKSLIASLVVVGGVVAAIAVVALLLGSVGGGESSDEVGREPLTIVTANGTTARLAIEVADTPEERSRGLSHRTELPPDTGMLFVIPERGPGFWMRDTFVPLSVAFIGECGEILDIQDMEPQTLEIHQSETDYKFGLEAPQGWFATNGVGTGDIVSIPREYRYEGC